MANNVLIQGAALTSKKFLDIGKAVSQGLIMAGAITRTPPTAQKNQDYQNKVNSYMGKLKTGMDFTAFSPDETKNMRTFLVKERSKYAEAAKQAAAIQDTTDPEYMRQVDIMNDVNNSYQNLAAQLTTYKKSKVGFAEDMMKGDISLGNDDTNTRENMVAYGFYDADGDGKTDKNYQTPFTIQQGGNVAFEFDGQEIAYNDLQPPMYKDSKLANEIITENEKAFTAGKKLNQWQTDQYRLSLQNKLQNVNALKSIVYDFDDDGIPMTDIANTWDLNKEADGGIDKIRDMVVDRLVNARTNTANEGYKEAERKRYQLTPKEQYKLKEVRGKLKLLGEGSTITGLNGKRAKWAGAGEAGKPETARYVLVNSQGVPIIGNTATPNDETTWDTYSYDEIKEVLNLRARGL